MKTSLLESLFAEQARSLPVQPEREYRFHPERRWRLDFAWVEEKIALEIEGGIYVAGRHGRGAGIAGDIEKGNAAVLLGWRLLRATNHMIEDGTALDLVRSLLAAQ